MPTFHGFPDGKFRLTPIPAPFFAELLPEIDHLGELKVTLYAFWQFGQQEGEFHSIRHADFEADKDFMAGLAKSSRARQAALDEALERAVARGTLLKVDLEQDGETEAVFFLNSSRGRAAVEAIRSRRWKPAGAPKTNPLLAVERPNIFRLYEQNIGPLTPMIADILRDAEAQYSLEWIQDALRIALENNVRNWRYVEAILRSWKDKGRDEQDRRDPEKARRKYIEGEFADFVEH